MTGHIFIEGEIGEEVSTKTVRNDIALYPEATEFIVHINSTGGDVYEGYNIGQIIRGIGKKTTAQIGAMCASIASFDAVCCDEVIMAPQGDFMIHLPTGTMSGTAEDLRKGAAQLDRIKSELIDRYMSKVAKHGLTRDKLSAMIDNETSMSPQEAAKFGFVDHVQERMKAVAKWDMKKFQNTDMEKEKVEGMFAAFGNKLDAILGKFKTIKNIDVTLADGTIVQSSADTPDAVVGSTLTGPDGPLAPGTYESADGKALVVVEGGVVQSAEPITMDKTDMAKLKEENAALKQQLEAATKAVAEQTSTVEAVAKQLKEFSNMASELKNVKAEFDKMKNETFGDKTVIVDAPDKKETKKFERHPLMEEIHNSLGKLVFKN